MDLSANITNTDNRFYIIPESEKKDSSYYSFKIGLEAYFSTYHNAMTEINNKSQIYDSSFGCDKNKINAKITNKDAYIECSINTWIHLQHFFELETKKLLRANNPVLASSISDAVIIYKCLNGTPLSDDEENSLKSLEFSEAFDRLCNLVDKGYLTDDTSCLFANNKIALKFITRMRNMVLHRGKRIIKYCELDEVMSQNVLPIIYELLDYPQYKEINRCFKTATTKELIKPIIDAGKKTPLDFSEIALYKEIARCKALENNDYFHDEDYNEKLIKNEIALSKIKNELEMIVDVGKKCPCCNNNSLLSILDYTDIQEITEDDYIDEIDYVPPKYTMGIAKVSCAHCGLYINRFIKEMSDYGLTGYDKIWD